MAKYVRVVCFSGQNSQRHWFWEPIKLIFISYKSDTSVVMAHRTHISIFLLSSPPVIVSYDGWEIYTRSFHRLSVTIRQRVAVVSAQYRFGVEDIQRIHFLGSWLSGRVMNRCHFTYFLSQFSGFLFVLRVDYRYFVWGCLFQRPFQSPTSFSLKNQIRGKLENDKVVYKGIGGALANRRGCHPSVQIGVTELDHRLPMPASSLWLVVSWECSGIERPTKVLTKSARAQYVFSCNHNKFKSLSSTLYAKTSTPQAAAQIY